MFCPKDGPKKQARLDSNQSLTLFHKKVDVFVLTWLFVLKISLLALMWRFYTHMPCFWLQITQIKTKLLIKTRRVNFTWVKSKDLPLKDKYLKQSPLRQSQTIPLRQNTVHNLVITSLFWINRFNCTLLINICISRPITRGLWVVNTWIHMKI